MALASLFCGYLTIRFVTLFEAAPPGNLITSIIAALDGVWPSIRAAPFMFGGSKSAYLCGLFSSVIPWLIYFYQLADGKRMYGKEHGSSEWGTARDIAPLTDKDPEQNIILSATEQISIRKVKFEADRNKNVLIVGGSGSGKTYGQVKPNLMQLHSSYVITDPKGTLLPDTGYLFLENGYRLRAFNTINFSKSLHYNPLAYIHSDKDILKVVNVLITNTSGDGQTGDKFWVDCERLLYTALIAYLVHEAPPEDCNIPTMIDILEKCEVRENDEDFKNPVDIIFDDLAEQKPTCLAVKQYKKFRMAAGDTMKSILISCAARLAPFDIDELREIMMYDELELDTIGDHKTAFFVIMSDTDSTYSFVIAMIMYQMFNLLCEKADDEYGGKLPFHVRCILDEFANIGKIPDFERLISTIRSREISATILLQSLSQLSATYKDNADTILDCCDSLVFLGGKSEKTTQTLSKVIGKTTIENRNTTENRGQSGGYSLQDQTLGRDLIDPAEVGRLKRRECLVLITGLPPFKSKKYDSSRHKRFCYLADSKKRPTFKIEDLEELESEHFLDNVKTVQDVDLSELNLLK